VSGEVLRVSGLHAYYGESHILHGVDFSVNRGKWSLSSQWRWRTTTLKAILGLVGKRPPVRINGARPSACRPPGGAPGVGLPEERHLRRLSAEENLEIPPTWPAACHREVRDVPSLRERRDTQGTRLSGGSSRCSPCTHPAHRARLLLDEISEGLAPVIVQACRPSASCACAATPIVMVEQNFTLRHRWRTPLHNERGRIVRPSPRRNLRQNGAGAELLGI
jgi:branched-chain amino acid transport system ATP-binding protein